MCYKNAGTSFFFILSQCTRLTDRLTDRQTDRKALQYRALHYVQSHGKNKWCFLNVLWYEN